MSEVQLRAGDGPLRLYQIDFSALHFRFDSLRVPVIMRSPFALAVMLITVHSDHAIAQLEESPGSFESLSKLLQVPYSDLLSRLHISIVMLTFISLDLVFASRFHMP